MSPEKLAELRKLAEAATAGPWAWRGNVDGLVELRGHGPFGRYDGRVVTAHRAEPCIVETQDEDVVLTIDACPACLEKWAEMVAEGTTDVWEGYQCPKAENLATVWLTERGVGIRPANTWAMREVPYRTDVASVDHPDAAYIAAVSPDVVLGLLDELDRLRAVVSGDGDPERPVCATCHGKGLASYSGRGEDGPVVDQLRRCLAALDPPTAPGPVPAGEEETTGG